MTFSKHSQNILKTFLFCVHCCCLSTKWPLIKGWIACYSCLWLQNKQKNKKPQSFTSEFYQRVRCYREHSIWKFKKTHKQSIDNFHAKHIHIWPQFLWLIVSVADNFGISIINIDDDPVANTQFLSANQTYNSHLSVRTVFIFITNKWFAHSAKLMIECCYFYSAFCWLLTVYIILNSL